MAITRLGVPSVTTANRNPGPLLTTPMRLVPALRPPFTHVRFILFVARRFLTLLRVKSSPFAAAPTAASRALNGARFPGRPKSSGHSPEDGRGDGPRLVVDWRAGRIGGWLRVQVERGQLVAGDQAGVHPVGELGRVVAEQPRELDDRRSGYERLWVDAARAVQARRSKGGRCSGGLAGCAATNSSSLRSTPTVLHCVA